MHEGLRAFLHEAGASADEIARAAEQGWLPLLAIDRALMPGRPRYDITEVVAAAGIDEELGRRMWRAMGFADVPNGLAVFGDHDLAVLRLVLERLPADGDWDDFLRQARVISAAMARLGEIDAELLDTTIAALREQGLGEDEVAAAVVEQLDWPGLSAMIDYVHRTQARAAVWRRLARQSFTDAGLAIGFADLSGYTALSARLEPDELSALLARWEELTHDAIASWGARVVKTIGDEVMFAGPADAVTAVALEVAAATVADPELPPVRIGLAYGPVVARDGDYYGAVVNLASRLTELAPPGGVLASAGLHGQLVGRAGFVWEPHGRRHVRGIGVEEVYTVRDRG